MQRSDAAARDGIFHHPFDQRQPRRQALALAGRGDQHRIAAETQQRPGRALNGRPMPQRVAKPAIQLLFGRKQAHAAKYRRFYSQMLRICATDFSLQALCSCARTDDNATIQTSV
jgi:hypothetical protein